VNKDGGKHPKWNYDIDLNVLDYADVIDFEVKDESLIKDSSIGRASFRVGSLLKNLGNE